MANLIDYTSQVKNTPAITSTMYDFNPFTGGVTLTASVEATVPVPSHITGINASSVNAHYLRIVNTNSALNEVVLLTAGTVAGSAVFTPANSHTAGAYTIGSATAGIQEALYSTTPVSVYIPPGNYTLYKTLFVTGRGGSDCNIFGAGTIASRLIRDSSFPAGNLVTASTLISEGRIYLRDLSILNANGFENTSGAGLYCEPTQMNSIYVQNVEVLNGYNPIRLDGSGLVVMSDTRGKVLTNYSGLYSCGDAIYVAASAYIRDCVGEVQVPNATHGAGIRVRSADGLNVIGGAYMGRYNVLIDNDATKIFNFAYFDSCILDSSFSHGIYVAPGAHNAVFSQLRINNCHIATQGGDPAGCGIYIANDLQSLVISNCNISGSPSVGIVLGISDKVPRGVTVTGNCINNCGDYGIVIPSASGLANCVITGNQIGNSVNNYGPANQQEVGVYFVGATMAWNNYTVVGNDLNGNLAAPIAFDAGPTNAVVWHSNSGVDNVVTAAIASAASIALSVYPVFGISGTTGIGTITGPLAEGHQWTLIPSGVMTFTAGATIGNTFTTTVGVPIVLTVFGGKVYIK